MVDALSAISGNVYSGYDFPAKTQNSKPIGQAGGSTDSLPAVYDPYDLDGDGELSYSEYQAYLEAMGLLQSSSLIALDTGELQTVPADIAKAAYQVNAGNGVPGLYGAETQGTGTYTPISIIV